MKKFVETKQAISEQAVRESISLAVMNVLRTHGLEKLTIQRVASEAHIAAGTVYNYFKDKDELLVYTAERLFDRIRDLMRKAVEEKNEPHAKLLEMIRCSFSFFSENSSFFEFLDRAQIYSKMHQSVKQAHVEQVRMMFAQVLQEGIEGGFFKKVNVETTADFFHRAIVGTICLIPELDVFDPDREAQSLAKMFFTLLE